MRNNYWDDEIKACKAMACQLSDSRAHCHVVIKNPYAKPNIPKIESILTTPLDKLKTAALNFNNELGDKWIFPCRLLLPPVGRIQLDKEHPSTPQDQVHALAIREGVGDCPHFDKNGFKDTSPSVSSQKE